MSQVSTEFIPTRIAILTVSNRRGEEDDTSGHYLRDSAQEAGHHVVDKAIVKENRYAIRAQVSAWIASDDVQVVLPKRCCRCSTVKLKVLVKCSGCCRSKRLALPRCNLVR